MTMKSRSPGRETSTGTLPAISCGGVAWIHWVTIAWKGLFGQEIALKPTQTYACAVQVSLWIRSETVSLSLSHLVLSSPARCLEFDAGT